MPPTLRPAAAGSRKATGRLRKATVKIRENADFRPLRLGDDGAVKILLVEDEDSIAEPLETGLRREGFEVERAATAADALAAPPADCVLLDLRLPDEDGYTVCRRLRERSRVPIIMVTARGEEVDRVVGLELGADDYVVKPFGLRELIARIRAVTRRAAAPPAEAHRVGALEVDARTRRATVAGRPVELTAKEFDILAALAEDPGAVVTRSQLLQRIWGVAWYGQTKTLDVHVGALRRKLGDPAWIETVRGIGFRLRER
jgi:two-component system response regulator RegX3